MHITINVAIISVQTLTMPNFRLTPLMSLLQHSLKKPAFNAGSYE